MKFEDQLTPSKTLRENRKEENFFGFYRIVSISSPLTLLF
jgi:hypothetical protein